MSMKKLLITGAGPNGITGRLAKQYFEDRYEVLTPSSVELDLTDSTQVSEYFRRNKIDYVLHCATFRNKISNQCTFANTLLNSNLRMYFNLAAEEANIEKIVYLGSGAEYDKSRSICYLKEEDFGKSIPKDDYGLSKYIMTLHARQSKKIVNLRLFGTISPFEKPTKNVISNLCVKAVKGAPLELNRNCRFSFAFIPDVFPIIEHMLSNKVKYHDYNVAMPSTYLLSDIGEMIADIAAQRSCHCQQHVAFKEPGISNEYSCDCQRLMKEIVVPQTSIYDAIKAVYDHYESIIDEVSIEGIDNRWSV